MGFQVDWHEAIRAYEKLEHDFAQAPTEPVRAWVDVGGVDHAAHRKTEPIKGWTRPAHADAPTVPPAAPTPPQDQTPLAPATDSEAPPAQPVVCQLPSPEAPSAPLLRCRPTQSPVAAIAVGTALAWLWMVCVAAMGTAVLVVTI